MEGEAIIIISRLVSHNCRDRIVIHSDMNQSGNGCGNGRGQNTLAARLTFQEDRLRSLLGLGLVLGLGRVLGLGLVLGLLSGASESFYALKIRLQQVRPASALASSELSTRRTVTPSRSSRAAVADATAGQSTVPFTRSMLAASAGTSM